MRVVKYPHNRLQAECRTSAAWHLCVNPNKRGTYQLVHRSTRGVSEHPFRSPGRHPDRLPDFRQTTR